MVERIGIRVVYRDEKLSPVCEKVYPLRDYTDMLKNDLLRLITDIEDAFYVVNDNKPKSEWTDDTWAAFSKIKHKILDKAGSIGRLPDEMVKLEQPDNDNLDIEEFIKSVFREGNDT